MNDRGSRPTVDGVDAERAAGEELERVEIYRPDGVVVVVSRAQVLAIDLAGLALAWKDSDGKIHRTVGLPLDAVFVESRIIKPV